MARDLVSRTVVLDKSDDERFRTLAFALGIPEDDLLRALVRWGTNDLDGIAKGLDYVGGQRDIQAFSNYVKGQLYERLGWDGSMPEEVDRMHTELDTLEQAFKRDMYSQ